MDTDKIITFNLENAKLVAKGIYRNLHCSNCNNLTSEAFFTKHIKKEKYGIWFECKNCGNVDHISCREKPEGYSEDRISKIYQNLDECAWKAEDTTDKTSC